MVNGWTLERRQRQAEMIREWQPWQHATGPTTKAGKARSAMRGYKGGFREKISALRKILREQGHVMQKLTD